MERTRREHVGLSFRLRTSPVADFPRHTVESEIFLRGLFFMGDQSEKPLAPSAMGPSGIPITPKTQKKVKVSQTDAPGKTKKKTGEVKKTERPGFWKKHREKIFVAILIAIISSIVTDVYTTILLWGKRLVGLGPPAISTQMPTVPNSPQNDEAIAKVNNEGEYDTFTFRFTDPNKKLFTFGDCPGQHCYTVERGEMYTMWWVPSGRELTKANGQETKGITFYIYGTGFVTDSRLFRNMILTEQRLFDIKMGAQGGLFGTRLLYVDGSVEDRWLNSDGSEPEWRKPPTKEFKNYQLAVWLPLKKEAGVSISTLDKDITLTVKDDSTNGFTILETVRQGTFCSRKHPSVAPRDIELACKGK